ncbi:MAG: ATP-binding cassette domain-containing protein, partial [Elusimicrobiota bacterium]
DNLLSIMENIYNKPLIVRNQLDEVLGEYGLEKLADSKAYTLSGGERRRLEIARALIMNPKFVLLDEPFTGIDPLAIIDLQKILISLKNKGIGLLLTDHSVRETLRITDRAYIIDKGKIYKEGKPEELVISDEVKKQYLGKSFTLN